jgi:hypothetical protein
MPEVVFSTYADVEEQRAFEAELAGMAAERARVASLVHSTHLDGTLASLEALEKMIGNHAYVFERLSAKEQTRVVLGYGAYLGEVMRTAIGGRWGRVTLDGETFSGLQLGNGMICWPHDRVRKRLLLGDQYEVVGYAEEMCRGRMSSPISPRIPSSRV